MIRKLNRNAQCRHCRMYLDLCLCDQMIPIALKTKLVIFMHHGEFSLVTNTGTLAHRLLSNSQIVYRGHTSRKVVSQTEFISQKSSTFILYPEGAAETLDDSFVKKHPGPLTLICPDGHWGQAKKIIRQEPSLQNIPFVKLPSGGPPSTYRLRRNQLEGNVCTFEAIARALGVIEGPDVQNKMEAIFNKMVTRLLWTRGKGTKAEVDW